MPDIRRTIARLAAEAARERDKDDAYWTREAIGQDTEESEHSGYLIGRAEALADVLKLLDA